MDKRLIVIFLLLAFQICLAQEKYHLISSRIFKEVRDDPNNPPPTSFDVIGYEPDAYYKKMWTSLVQSIITLQNSEILNSIIIRSGDVQGIFAVNTGGKNIIFYNKDFFEQFRDVPDCDVDYFIVFSFLHEAAHFVNGDVKNQKQTKESEYKADMFACHSLCKNNKASAEKIHSTILTLDGATSSPFYLSKGERLKSLYKFFSEGNCALSPLIYFEFDSSVLKTSSYQALDRLSGLLRETGRKINIIGHHYGGTEEYDRILSLNRANSVKTYLINSGVDSKLLSVKGMGHSQPVASGATEEGRNLNRRVEFSWAD